MTETNTPAAEAVATTVVASEQAVTPATEETTAPETLETAEQPETKTEQLRDDEGKFLPKHPRVEKLQTKINELTRVKHDTVREVERLRAEAAELRKQLSQEPDLAPDDFRGQQSYEVKKALKEERLDGIQNRAQYLEAAAEHASTVIIATQAEALRDQITDIDRIWKAPADGGPPLSKMMVEAMARVENGALVAYHLSKNPREAARLMEADPMTVATEIGRLSAQVKPATPVRRVSQAPQPVQTVSGSNAAPSPDIAALSFKDYEALMNKRELERMA